MREPNPQMASFDEAAERAKVEFDEMVKAMTPEQKEAITKIQAWWKSWFMSAGHKRLGRIINGR